MYLLKYLFYVLEHKWNVFKISIRKGYYWHALTHDLSKFSGSEFWSYAGYFYKDKEKYKHRFEMAWRHHYFNNKHHCQHWLNIKGEPMDIPDKYIEQMIIDWEAMGLKFGDTAKEYYLDNKEDILLSPRTRINLELKLCIKPERCLGCKYKTLVSEGELYGMSEYGGKSIKWCELHVTPIEYYFRNNKNEYFCKDFEGEVI